MNQRRNEGITLIALVITIIILLILAGVTISAVTGDEGIIKQAEAAKEQQREASLKEEIKMYNGERKIENYGGEKATEWDKFVADLQKKELITDKNIEKDDEGKIIKVKVGEIEVTPPSKENTGSTGGEQEGGDVEDEEIVATSIEIADNYKFLSPDDEEYATMELTATTTPPGAKVTWTSSDPTKVTVDENGVVTALEGASGEVTITATLGEVSSEPYRIKVGEIAFPSFDSNGFNEGITVVGISGMTWSELMADDRFNTWPVFGPTSEGFVELLDDNWEGIAWGEDSNGNVIFAEWNDRFDRLEYWYDRLRNVD